MLTNLEMKPPKGFLGAAKSSTHAPYREVDRRPELCSHGKDSYFITPEKREDIEKCPRGIKR